MYSHVPVLTLIAAKPTVFMPWLEAWLQRDIAS